MDEMQDKYRVFSYILKKVYKKLTNLKMSSIIFMFYLFLLKQNNEKDCNKS